LAAEQHHLWKSNTEAHRTLSILPQNRFANGFSTSPASGHHTHKRTPSRFDFPILLFAFIETTAKQESVFIEAFMAHVSHLLKPLVAPLFGCFWLPHFSLWAALQNCGESANKCHPFCVVQRNGRILAASEFQLRRKRQCGDGRA